MAGYLEYTCACRPVAYEFRGRGGTYVICRIPPFEESYVGPWRRREAERMWMLIVTGQACLRLAGVITPRTWSCPSPAAPVPGVAEITPIP